MKGAILFLCLLPMAALGQVTTFSKVIVQCDNAQCVNGNSCSIAVYRATCTTASSCPAYAKGSTSFTKLPDKDASGNSYSQQTITASNTHFTYTDMGVAPNTFGYATNYVYAVTNTFLANPSLEGGAATVKILTPSGPHQATLNWSNPNCRTGSTCDLKVYRAQCASATNCPTYVAGNSAWKALDMSTNLTATVGAQATTWQYLDKDATLAGSTTYSWVATNQYSGNTTASGASSPYIGTTK